MAAAMMSAPSVSILPAAASHTVVAYAVSVCIYIISAGSVTARCAMVANPIAVCIHIASAHVTLAACHTMVADAVAIFIYIITASRVCGCLYRRFFRLRR